MTKKYFVAFYTPANCVCVCCVCCFQVGSPYIRPSVTLLSLLGVSYDHCLLTFLVVSNSCHASYIFLYIIKCQRKKTYCIYSHTFKKNAFLLCSSLLCNVLVVPIKMGSNWMGNSILSGVVGSGNGVVYLTSPGRPTEIGLQLGKACYPCSR